MNITFLGTGTSQGVPMIGCGCPVCVSTDLRDKRTRSSIYVETPEAAFVIDTGPEFRVQCLRESVSRVDAVVYTHSHTDHIMGFDDLRRFCPAGRSLPIYAGEETIADLTRIFPFAFLPEPMFPGYTRPDPRVVSEPFDIGRTTLTPLPVEHGRAKVFGYLFEREGRAIAAYLSDCKVIPNWVTEKIRGVDTLIVDALRHTPHPTHMNIAEALAFRDAVKARETWFTHICHDLAHEATQAQLPADVRLAWDGLKITL